MLFCKIMDEEMLIHYVKKYEELYDPRNRKYKDQNRRELIWRKIAKKMELQAHECKERWKKVRENYRKATKLRQTQKCKGIKINKPIKHGHLMAFIDEKIETEHEQDSSQNTERQTTSFRYPGKPETYGHPDPIDPLISQERNEIASKNDTVVTFFTNLGETVKTFPVDVQIRVKRDIFKIINDAEEEVVMNRLKVRHRDNDYGLDY